MDNYQTIPKIKQEAKKILQQLNLKPLLDIDYFIKNKKRFFSVPCLQKDNKIFFKLLIQNSDSAYYPLLHEIKLTKIISSCKNFKIPKYIKSNISNSPIWYIHQYLEGGLLGRFYEANQIKNKSIKGIINNLIAFRDLPKVKLKKVKKEIKNLEERCFFAYIQRIKDYEKNIGQSKTKIDFKKIYNFFQKNKNIFEKYPLILTHGDFTLENQFIHKSKVYLTDFEWVRFDNLTADLAHLWIQTWRYPQWRKNLLLSFLSSFKNKKKMDVKKIFRLTVISEALGEIRWNSEICKKKYKKEVIKISSKTIMNSLKGFNYLL